MLYGSAKIEWKIKVCDGKQGFCCQDDRNENCRGNQYIIET